MTPDSQKGQMEQREILPWEVRIPKSIVVEHPIPGSIKPDCSVILDEDGCLWLREEGGDTALVVIRADRVRIVDDAATDLVIEVTARNNHCENLP